MKAQSDILEIGGGVHESLPHAAEADGHPRSWYTAFRNSIAEKHFPTFEQAMRHHWPEWQPQGNGHEPQMDNF